MPSPDITAMYSRDMVAFVPREDHPLDASGLLLPGDARFFQITARLGNAERVVPANDDGLTFWEETMPVAAANPEKGHVMSMGQYEDIVTQQAQDETGRRSMPLAASEWRAVPDQSTLYIAGLHAQVDVALPEDPEAHQIQATTVFRKDQPAGVPAFRGADAVAILQAKGFAPRSFGKLALADQTQQAGQDLMSGVTSLMDAFGMDKLGAMFRALGETGVDKALGAVVPDRQLQSVVRTSLHVPRSRPAKG